MAEGGVVARVQVTAGLAERCEPVEYQRHDGSRFWRTLCTCGWTNWRSQRVHADNICRSHLLHYHGSTTVEILAAT